MEYIYRLPNFLIVYISISTINSIACSEYQNMKMCCSIKNSRKKIGNGALICTNNMTKAGASDFIYNKFIL